MQQQKKSSGDLIDFLVSITIAIVPMIAILLFRFVLLPGIKWAGKKAWTAAKKQYAKPRTKKQKDAAKATTLPTPDIFKDAPNLAPMKEFRF